MNYQNTAMGVAATLLAIATYGCATQQQIVKKEEPVEAEVEELDCSSEQMDELEKVLGAAGTDSVRKLQKIAELDKKLADGKYKVTGEELEGEKHILTIKTEDSEECMSMVVKYDLVNDKVLLVDVRDEKCKPIFVYEGGKRYKKDAEEIALGLVDSALDHFQTTARDHHNQCTEIIERNIERAKEMRCKGKKYLSTEAESKEQSFNKSRNSQAR